MILISHNGLDLNGAFCSRGRDHPEVALGEVIQTSSDLTTSVHV